jgi:hypothetical protein
VHAVEFRVNGLSLKASGLMLAVATVNIHKHIVKVETIALSMCLSP